MPESALSAALRVDSDNELAVQIIGRFDLHGDFVVFDLRTALKRFVAADAVDRGADGFIRSAFAADDELRRTVSPAAGVTRCDAQFDHENLIGRFAGELQRVLEFGWLARCKRFDEDVTVLAGGFDFERRIELFDRGVFRLKRIRGERTESRSSTVG